MFCTDSVFAVPAAGKIIGRMAPLLQVMTAAAQVACG
jgi:hypothetical protein